MEIEIENKIIDIVCKIPFEKWDFKTNSPHGTAETMLNGKKIIIKNYLCTSKHWVTIDHLNICEKSDNKMRIEKFVNELKNYHRTLMPKRETNIDKKEQILNTLCGDKF